ncbi:MAG: hypothetical protein GTO14_25655 [Anaerolineales bacterium]|nr:hypothetical protein [Anaerolineales bacterium]
MVKVEGSVVINRPVEEVFAFLTNPENASVWQGTVLESKQTSDGPVGVGTTGHGVSQFLGRRIESDWEVTEYEPYTKASLKSTSGPVPYEQSATLESIGEGTKVTLVARYEVGGFFKLAEPIVARLSQRQSEADFANLKDLVEAMGEGVA